MTFSSNTFGGYNENYSYIKGLDTIPVFWLGIETNTFFIHPLMKFQKGHSTKSISKSYNWQSYC